MRVTAKLLPVLLLGSALGGCSMAGTGDYFADEYAPMQQAAMPHYWGEPGGCQPSACDVAYPAAPQHAATYPYGASASQPCGVPAPAPVLDPCGVPAPHAYGQAVQTYQGHHGYQGYQGQPQYGYAPSYHNSHGGSSKGLREAYTYGSLGAVMYDVDSELFGVQGRLGWQSKSFFGAEIEGSLGVTDDDATVDFGGVPLTAELGIDTQIAGFGVARFPLNDRLNILGRVGYHNTEFSGEVTDGVTTADLDFSTDGIAYGAGVEYAIGKRTSLRADYTIYDFDGPDADAVSLAIARKF